MRGPIGPTGKPALAAEHSAYSERRILAFRYRARDRAAGRIGAHIEPSRSCCRASVVTLRARRPGGWQDSKLVPRGPEIQPEAWAWFAHQSGCSMSVPCGAS